MVARTFYGASTTIRCFTYDPAARTLSITFSGGLIHDYENIPQTVAWGLRGASEAGDYYRSRIRNRFRPVATYF